MKKIIIALSMIPVLSFGLNAEQIEAFNKANRAELQKKGLLTPDCGVQIVPRNSIKAASWQKIQYDAYAEEMKAHGYVNKESMRAYEVMHIESQIKKIRPLEKNSYKGTDSHMRDKAEEIPFAYTYVGVPKEVIVNFFGIAPAGTYVKEPVPGWNGAVSFFETSFAHCAYTENNFIVSHGAARISEEDSTNEVNGKITLIDIVGNESTGFLYQINWFDNVFNHNLECAVEKFDNDIKEKTIELARIIDKA